MKLVLTLLLLPGLLLGACQRASSTQAPRAVGPPAPPGKACQRMCWRTFGECTREVLTLTIRVPPKQLAKYERAGLLRAFQSAGFQRCMSMCGRAGTVASRQSLIASCMRLPTCNQYATCIAPRGGMPSATSGTPAKSHP